MTTDQLMKEIERYLAAVALFRELGCQPTWIRESQGAPIPIAPHRVASVQHAHS
jgi:hypothetical protein